MNAISNKELKLSNSFKVMDSKYTEKKMERIKNKFLVIVLYLYTRLD